MRPLARGRYRARLGEGAGDVLTAQILTGAALTMGGAVKAEIVAQTKSDKIIIFKKKRRHNYRRRNGHRQDLTSVTIREIRA